MGKYLTKIGICDNSICLCSEIEKNIIKYCENIKEMVSIEIYYSGKKLCEDLKSNIIYDLLFLEIELNGDCSGIEIGKYIREELKNEFIQIVFISAHKEHAMKLFKIRPMDFLIKPISDRMIFETVKTGIRLTKSEGCFQYKQGRNLNKVYIRDILYFKSKDREVEMITINGKISFYDSLESIYNRLKNFRFFYAHKSYLVNYLHILEFYYDKLIMSNREVIRIAQTRRKVIREMHKRYLIKEIENIN